MAFLSWKPLNSMPNTKNACVFLLMFVWWFLMTITLSPPPVGCIPTGTNPGIMCKNIERQALLTLKAGLVDKVGRLSSWSDDNPNCCNWKGVSCSNHTGHVFKLNLRNPFQDEDDGKYFQYMLEGEISSSLLELKYLEYLDLSQNDFNNTKVPAFLGSLEELRYLNLYSSSFSGVVPPSLGNLSRLEYLDLGSSYYIYSSLEVGSLQWLTGMSSLTYLNLDGVDLSKAKGANDWWGEVFNKLPNLLELLLSGCRLSNLPMSINHHPMNFTSSLSILDLSYNDGLEVGSLQWLTGMSSLTYLDLSLNFFDYTKVPAFLGSLEELRYLNLSSSYFSGVVPPSLGNLSRLEYLDLGSRSYNSLEVGSLQWLTGMSSLTHLNLDQVDLSKAEGADDWLGEVFIKLPNLLELHLRGCRLSKLPMSINHHPINFTSSLSILDLSSNDFSSSLGMPPWLFNLTALVNLQFYGCSFRAPFNIPHEFGRLVALQQLDLSYNKGIGGQLPASLGNLTNLVTLNLMKYPGNSLGIEGRIPVTFRHLCKLRELNLGDNRLEGDIHEFIDGLVTCSSDHPRLETLSLSYNRLVGTLPSSLGHLCKLRELDLGGNRLEGDIHEFIDGLVTCSSDHPRLETLSLSYNRLVGTLPSSLGHLCKLRELDLGGNRLEGDIHEFIDGLVTCSSDHPRLETLSLSYNRLVGTLPSSLGHLCKLRELDLGGNRLEGDIHEFIDGLARCSSDHPHLETLYLSGNKLLGTLPSSLGSLSNLVSLDLASNSFWGSIPTSTGSLTALRSLDLSSNKLNGTIAGRLPPDLETLDLSYNQWREEMLNESHFEKLTKLESLDLSSTSSKEGNLVLNVTQDWLPPFRRSLYSLRLSGVKMNSKKFPRWTQTLRELGSLSLRHCGIADSIPTEFWTSCPKISDLYLSNNAISIRTTFINMGRLLPHLVPAAGKLRTLDLANNSFGNNGGGGSGIEIPSNIGQLFPSLQKLDLSSNSLSGAIPRSISRIQYLRYLILRNNVLTGELTYLQWDNLTSLFEIDLSNNSLVGKIPESLAHLPKLGFLLLNDNSLEGEIPALPNLPRLFVLDLGGNKLSGNIPPTLASHSPYLLVFRLRGNMLSGTIPLEFCLLSNLQTLDLAHNNFTGTIPWCLGNLSTSDSNLVLIDGIALVVKGREYKYDAEILSLVHLVDLSHNSLSGNIPESLMNLTAMQTLNLSMNHLTGEIPSNIGLLQKLETLDISQNHLSGPIPLSISDISSLNYLNLSHNDLSGRIPLSRQLQTLDTNSSSYDGNPLLCGDPLPTKCSGDGPPKDPQGEGEEKVGHRKRKFDIEEWGFVLSIVLGFVVGFWGVCGSLVLKPS